MGLLSGLRLGSGGGFWGRGCRGFRASIFGKLKIKVFFGALMGRYEGELHFGFNSRIWRVFIGKNGYSRL